MSRLVEFDQGNLLPEEKFYANGFELMPLMTREQLRSLAKGIANADDLVDLLRGLWEGDAPKPGFSWEQKGQTSFHLRPAAFEYDRMFVDFLMTHRVKEHLRELTGKDLHLCHVQIVKTIPGPSYQDWHRDAYQFGSDPLVGAFPPTVKLNFYPSFGDPEPRLRFVRGSHRCMANDARFDAMLVSKYENEVLHSDNTRALIFETSMLHGVVPDVNPRGSIRLMYSFVMEHEYLKRFEPKEHHRRLHDLYEGMIEGQKAIDEDPRGGW